MKFKTNVMKHLFYVLCVSILFIGCSPEDGKNGSDGVDGINGSDGSDGQTGTANVIYSDWIARDFDTGGASETNQQLIATLGLNDIDMDEDVVLVFGRNVINVLVTDVYQLPYVLASQDEYYGFRLSSFNGGFALRVETSTLDGGTNLFTFFNDFRYVIIPGGTASSRSANSTTSVDYSNMSYEEIIAHFNIPN